MEEIIETLGHNTPWESEEGRAVWGTEAQYWNWLRGSLRRLWSDYPLRVEWKNRKLRPVSSDEKVSKIFHPSTKRVGQCSLCMNWFPGGKLECDHIFSSEGCTSKETAEKFLWYCGGLTGDMFQLVCKPCHKIKSYSERMGVSFEQAVAEKKAIAIQKQKGYDVVWLEESGVVPGKNAKLRRQQIVDKLMEG